MFEEARKRGIPVFMLTSGGYQVHNVMVFIKLSLVFSRFYSHSHIKYSGIKILFTNNLFREGQLGLLQTPYLTCSTKVSLAVIIQNLVSFVLSQSCLA